MNILSVILAVFEKKSLILGINTKTDVSDSFDGRKDFCLTHATFPIFNEFEDFRLKQLKAALAASLPACVNDLLNERYPKQNR